MSKKMAQKGRQVGAGSTFIAREVAADDISLCYGEEMRALCRNPYRGHRRAAPTTAGERGALRTRLQ